MPAFSRRNREKFGELKMSGFAYVRELYRGKRPIRRTNSSSLEPDNAIRFTNSQQR
jgi:hypothetical protein